jgi:hypothetical protein
MRNNNVMRRVAGRLAAAAFVIAVAATVFAQASAPASSTPPAVTKAFQQAYPAASISGTVQERENDRPVYRVNGLDKGRKRVVLYDATGKAIEVAEQVEEKELPRPVADAMHSHPRAIYVTGLKVTRGGSVTYQLTVRGTRKTAMVAQPDGTVLSFK